MSDLNLNSILQRVVNDNTQISLKSKYWLKVL